MLFIKRSQLDLDSVVHKKVTIRSRVSFIKRSQRSQLDLDSVIHKKVTKLDLDNVVHKKVTKVTIRSRQYHL